MTSPAYQQLLDHFPRAGRLEWIGLRPARRQPIEVVDEVRVATGSGLEGDRAGARPGGTRQVTLIQAEHLPVIAGLLGIDEVKPEWLRRNLLVSDINLLALKDRQFTVGDVLLEGTGLCAPCAHMEEALGKGGFNAMRGHGGLTARVLSTGIIYTGDAIRLATDKTA